MQPRIDPELWVEAAGVEGGDAEPWPEPEQLVQKDWIKTSRTYKSMWRGLRKNLVDASIRSWLEVEYQDDPDEVPEIPTPGDYRALGVIGGRFHAACYHVLLDPIDKGERENTDPMVKMRLTIRAGQRAFWRFGLRRYLRILDLRHLTVEDGALLALGSPGPDNSKEVPWPHLTHFVLKGLRLERPNKQMDRLVQMLLGMPNIVYVEWELLTRTGGRAYPMPMFFRTSHPKLRALVATHKKYGYWPFSNLRVWAIYNTRWEDLTWHLLLAALTNADRDEIESDYLREHNFPGLEVPVPLAANRRPETGPGSKTPLVNFGILVDFFDRIYAPYAILSQGQERWIDPWPKLTYFSLRNANSRAWRTDDQFRNFVVVCMLWMERARLRSNESEWNTWLHYESRVAFPFYNTLGLVSTHPGATLFKLIDDIPTVDDDLRPWRFVHSMLDLSWDLGIQTFPGPSQLRANKALRSRSVWLTIFLHHLYLQCLMTHGRPERTEFPNDRAVRFEQHASLLGHFADVRPLGNMEREIRLGLGRGRSYEDGRGIAVLTEFPPNENYPLSIVLNLMPAILLFRSYDRPLTLSRFESWPPERVEREARWYQGIDAERYVLRQPEASLVIRYATNITHLVLRGVVLTQEMSRAQRNKYRRLTGRGTPGSRLIYEILANFDNLTVLIFDGRADREGAFGTPPKLLNDLMTMFTGSFWFSTLMVKAHQSRKRWPLQQLMVLQLHYMGLRWKMPWALLPIRYSKEVMATMPQAYDRNVDYIAQNYPTGIARGHMPQKKAYELLPRLMHLDLRHNRLLDVPTAEDIAAADVAKIPILKGVEKARREWFSHWIDRCVAVPASSPPENNWRRLSLVQLEKYVDTLTVFWSKVRPQPRIDHPTLSSRYTVPHVLSYATVDLRQNPLDLRTWSSESRTHLNLVRKHMYMSHVSPLVEGPRKNDLITYLMTDVFEFAVDRPQQREMIVWILKHWGSGCFDATDEAPLCRGFSLCMPRDQGARYLLHRLVNLSSGIDAKPLLFSPPDRHKQRYGMDSTRDDRQYGIYPPNPPPLTPLKALQDAEKEYMGGYRDVLYHPFDTSQQRRQSLVRRPEVVEQDIVEFVMATAPDPPILEPGEAMRRRAARPQQQLSPRRGTEPFEIYQDPDDDDDDDDSTLV